MGLVRKIHHLQTLRAIAASLVVADHALEYSIRRQMLGEDCLALAWALGWVGVAVFFVISGLIMVRSSYNSFGDFEQARRFGTRRILRIVPLYWLVLLVFLMILLARTNAVDLVDLVKSLLFIPYQSPGLSGMRPIASQGWTLNYEMMFYAIFTLSLTLKRIWGLAFIFAVLTGLVGYHLVSWPATPYSDPTTPLQFWTDPIILLFALGMVVGLLEQRAQRWHSFPYPVVFSLFLIISSVCVFVSLGGSFPLQIPWQAFFAVIAMCVVYACTSGTGTAVSRAGRMLENAGDASYSTYLIHPIVLMIFVMGWVALPRWMQDPIVFVVISILLCNFAGYFFNISIERPLGEKLRKFAEGERMLAKRAQPIV
ncbi:acyltransferase family protein [Bradyrhizobium sp. URHC0002]